MTAERRTSDTSVGVAGDARYVSPAVELPPLPMITAQEASKYGSFAVGLTVGPPRIVEALEPPPPATAWARDLLDHHDDTLTWDGERITITLDNGSWTWIAEAQSIDGRVVYARWPD